MTEAKYDELVKKLTDFNVALKDVNGNYRSTYDIMADIASKWDTMSNMEQSALATALAGTRQQAVFFSIIGQFKEASGAMDQMSRSAGELEKSYSIYMDSAQAKINQFKAGFQELSTNIFSSDTLGNLVDIGSTILDIVNYLAKANALLPTIATTIGAIKTIKLSKEVGATMAALSKGEKLSVILTLLSSILMLGRSLDYLFTEGFGWFKDDQPKEVARSLSDIESELKEIEDTAANTAKNFKSLKESADEIIPRFVQLSEGVDAFGNNINLSDSQYDEYISLNNKLAELFPSINMGMDSNGNAMLSLSGNADTLTKSLNELVEAQRKVANQEIAKQLPDAIKDINELNKRIDSTKKTTAGLNNTVWKDIYNNNTSTSYFKADDYGGVDEADLQSSNMLLNAARLGIKGYRTIQKDPKTGRVATFRIDWDYGSFDPAKAKQVYEDGLNEADKIINDADNAIKQRWKAVNPILSAWMQTDFQYNELNTQMQEIANAMVSGLNFSELGLTTENDVKSYVTDHIIKPLASSNDDVKKAMGDVVDLRAQLKAGEITPEDFANKTKSAFDKLKGSLNSTSLDALVAGFKRAGYEGNNFDEIIQSVITSWQKAGETGTSALTDLSDSLSNLKTRYDIITEAQKDMFDGGLSSDTIKSIKDALKDSGKDYLDYLYEENGVVKLNIEAWREYAESEMIANKQAIEQTIINLENENEKLRTKAQQLQNLGALSVNQSEQLSAYNKQIEDNTAKIDANQNKLSMYEQLYDKNRMSLDAYTLSLNNFANVSNTINTVSSSLTTVADIQERVRKGFTLSLEEAVKFADVYPEILNNAVATADGQVRLNSNVVNSFIKGKETELRGDLDTKIKQLEAEKEKVKAEKDFAEAQLKIAKDVAEGKSKATLEEAQYKINTANKVYNAMIAAGFDEVTANKEALRAMNNNFTEFDKAVAAVANDTSVNMGNASQAMAESAARNLYAMRKELFNTALQAVDTALAVIGIGNGKIFTSHLRGIEALSAGKSVAKISLTAGQYNGVDYKAKPQTITLEKFISDLQTDIKSYSNAMDQIDGQIATLRALRNTSLTKMSTDYKNALKEATSGKSGSSSSSDKSTSNDDNWFKRQYALHNHLLNMDAESVRDYLEWLNVAYKKAYNENLITLDEFYKYQEEVYQKLQELFKDYLSDVEHEISMRQNFEGDNKKIIALYKQLISDVEKEIRSARAQGLDDTDDYIQELQKKYFDYKSAIKSIEDELTDNAKDRINALVDIRIKMLKQDIENEKDAISKKLAMLKDFYDKQKQLLKEQNEEEKYLEEQIEKRKAVTDIQSKLTSLELDNSAWAQKKKLELAQELADAQKDLDDFEKEHSLKTAEETLDKLYEQQEKELNAQTELLDKKSEDTKGLYEQALADIKNGSINLYNEMIAWNNTYGDGIKDTIKEAWEEAYKALLNYKELYDKTFNGVTLANATNYLPSSEKWDSSAVGKPVYGSGAKNTATSTPQATSIKSSSTGSSSKATTATSKTSTSTTKSTTTSSPPKLTDDIKRNVAAAIWNGTMGWGLGADRTKKLTEVFGSNNGIQALVNQGIGAKMVANTAYSYLNMRKKFKGYATGTSHASPGLHSIDELGTETIFQSKNGNKYMMFTGGEKVLTAKASDFLYKFANKGDEIFSKIFGSFGGMKQSLSRGNVEIKTGDIIVNGNADRSTVSEIRRAQRESIETILKEFNKLNK